MILEQVYLWIAQNSEIYLRGRQASMNLEPGTKICRQQLRAKLQMIGCELKKRIPIMLKERKQANIPNFITFFIQNEPKSNQAYAHYHLNSNIKMLINHHNSRRLKVREEESLNLIKQLSSALMFDRPIVETLLFAFGRAVTDLVANGHELNLNFEACLIKISKKQCKCAFHKNFIRDLNTKKTEQSRQNLKVYICPIFKCPNKQLQNITANIRSAEQEKWEQIKQGNLYNRPSLQQIKHLYDRGRELQLKYRHHLES